MKKKQLCMLLLIAVGIFALAGCSPSGADKQAQAFPNLKSNQMSDADLQKIQAYINDQAKKISELQTQVDAFKAKESTQGADTDQLNGKVQETQTTINGMKEELIYYKDYAKNLTSLLPTDKIQQLVDKEWIYSATINGIAIPASGSLEVREPNFDLVFTEEGAKYSVLPEAERLKGKAGSNFQQTIVSTAIPQFKQEGNLSSITYSVKGLKSGESVSFKITDILMKKLDLQTPDLIIKMK